MRRMAAPADPPPEDIICPICGGKTELVYNRHAQKVYVCADCHAGLDGPVVRR